MEGLFIKRSNKSAPSLKTERTGVPTLDEVLKGGYLLGSLVLVEEEVLGNDGLQLARCFLGEGNVKGDKLLIYSDKTDLIPVLATRKQSGKAGLRIAWRYEHYSALNSSDYFFDLSKSDNCPIDVYRQLEGAGLEEKFSQIYDDIVRIPHSGSIRIFIDGDLEWTDFSERDVFKFLVSVRNIARSIQGTIMINVPLPVLPKAYVNIFRNAADLVLACECFADTNEEFGDFTGIFRIRKVLSLHSLMNTDYSNFTFGIKRTTKSISIESLSLPPDETIVQPKIEY